jgi:hypothetical protein
MEKEETEAKALFVTVCIKLDQTTVSLLKGIKRVQYWY